MTPMCKTPILSQKNPCGPGTLAENFHQHPVLVVAGLVVLAAFLVVYVRRWVKP